MAQRVDHFTLPERDSNGQLPAYAWPGGYPILYVSEDGLTLCAKCASTDTSDDVVSWDIHWEGEPEHCDDCGVEIPSAYGNPDEDEDEDQGDDALIRPEAEDNDGLYGEYDL